MTCHKAAFATRRLAEAERSLIMRRKRGSRLRVYQCSICGLWHMTSWSKSQERDRRRELRKQQEEQA